MTTVMSNSPVRRGAQHWPTSAQQYAPTSHHAEFLRSFTPRCLAWRYCVLQRTPWWCGIGVRAAASMPSKRSFAAVCKRCDQQCAVCCVWTAHGRLRPGMFYFYALKAPSFLYK